jgi:hypothetical protein
MTRLHPRYVEAFTPAVAAAAGIGVVWAQRAPARRAALALTLGGLAAYLWYLEDGPSATGLVTLAAAAGAIAASRSQRPPAGLIASLALVALLALPVTVAIGEVEDHASDAGRAGFMRPVELAHLSSYLRRHRGGARYEVAVTSATQAASLVVSDAQPVLVLTTYDGRTVVSAQRLSRLVAEGQVRYAILGGRCHPGNSRTLAQCSGPGRWIPAHGVDVSRRAGLRRTSELWLLRRR